MRRTGYAVHLVYFWLASADLAVSRVAERVSMGGHDIPEATIRQRYQRSLQNFFQLYRPVVSTWRVYDNTQSQLPQMVAHGDETGAETVLVESAWLQMQKGVR